MGQALWQKWLEEEVDDVQTALLMDGVAGLLSSFESWLYCNNLLKEEPK